MTQTKQYILTCLGVLLGLQSLQAQESLNAAGGSATGSGGSISYSVGQPFYDYNGNSTQGSYTKGVQFSQPNMWLGTVSTDFNNPANWSAGNIPTVAETIIVGSGGNILNITSSKTVNNVVVLPGATLNITATLSIEGSILNNGTINATNGTVELKGSAAQTIPSGAFAGNTVQNLIINNNNGVNLAGPILLTGVLQPNSGVLNTGGQLTLVSTDINGGGAIAQGSNSGGYISGTVNVQRYTQAQRGYRALAHPYTTGQPLSLLTNTIAITGLDFANGAFGKTSAGGGPSAFYYNPLKPAGDSLNVLEPITNPLATDKWSRGNGIFLFVRGYGNEGANGPGAGTYPSGNISPVTFTAANGIINQGTVTIPLLYGDATTDNFNLIGNPYPCPINLKNVAGIPLGTVYVYNPTKNIAVGNQYMISGGFDTYTHNGSNDIIVPNMGCFYVRTSVAGQSITFNESDKVTGLTPTYATFGTTKNPMVRVQIKNDKGIVDEVKIGYNTTSTGMATDTYDGTKKANSLMDLYTLSSDKKALAVDYRSDKFTDNIIPLGIKTALTGTYSIVANISDIANAQFVLRDKLLRKETVLGSAISYSFSITADALTKGDNRFEIGVLGTTVLPTTLTSFTAQLSNNVNAIVNWVSVTEVNADYYLVQRSTDGSNFTNVGKVAATGAGNYVYSDDLSTLNGIATIYYRLQMVDKDGSKTYSKIVAITPNSIFKAGLSIYPNPVKATLYAQVTTATAGKATITITDALGKLVLQQAENVNAGKTAISIQATQLPAGTYTLAVITSEGKQQQQFIKE
jgi:hypothetical protein